jgi:MurNAc alpha-1-phosphate uridylyltransferase
MILAAGRGNRLRPITDKTPKPLISINGKSTIENHLENLDRANFSNVVINVSHLGSKICKEFGYKFGKNISIRYSFEPFGALETAGGIAYAEPWTRVNDPFLVLNGDIWSDWNINEAYDIEEEIRKNALWGYLIMVDNYEMNQGDFFLDSFSKLFTNYNFSVQKKNICEKLTFSGFGIYTSKMFDFVAKGKRTALKPIFDFGINQHLIMGKKHNGSWADIGTHQALKKLRLQLAEKQRVK